MGILNKKGQIDVSTLIPWLIAVGVLVVMVVGYLIANKSGVGGISFLRDLFKFG